VSDTPAKKDECCPEFDPSRWEKKTHIWHDKKFIQDNVRQFLHIPLNMVQVVTKMFAKIEAAGACPPDEDFLMLAYDPSPWKSELYMTVTKEVPNARMTTISGTFISRVFDGPYNAIPKSIKEMDEYLAAQGKKALKYYIHYAYCPKCSKKFGHNYCIAFAQVA
jgi:hypothetical protein